MKKGRNTAEILESDGELDDIELSEGGGHERTLILEAAPRSRRVQLIAQGAKEIRCICCYQIRPSLGAEESEEGWICTDCVPEIMRELKYAGKRNAIASYGNLSNPIRHQRRTQKAEGEMMKPMLWLLLFLFLLGGCAATYTHPTKSTNDFERDRRECELVAKKALVAKGIPNT